MTEYITLGEALKLPLWTIYGAFAVAFISTFIHVITGLLRLVRYPKLEILLTREVFFRLNEWGECILSNAVLLARNGIVEIRNVEFELIKKSGAIKNYKLGPKHFGSKVPSTNSNPFAQNNFYTQSPLSFIHENSTERVIYLAVFDDYSDKIETGFKIFKDKIQAIKGQFRTDNNFNALTDIEKIKIIDNAEKAMMDSTESITSNIQLEEGEYTLKLIIKYKAVGVYRFLPTRTSESSISFTVSSNFREICKLSIPATLNTISFNLLLNANNVYPYPELTPTKIKETSD